MTALLTLSGIFCANPTQAQTPIGSAASVKKSPGGYSVARLVNQGNAYVRQGRYAHALVAYERARFLQPRDAAIVRGCEWLRERLSLPAEAGPWWKKWPQLLSLNKWTLAALASAVVLATLLQFYAWRGRRFRYAALVACIAGLFLLASAWAILQTRELCQTGIALAPRTVARLAPFAQAQSVAQLTAGQSAQIEKAYGGFYLVETSNGQRGWVASQEFEPIIPQ